MYDNILSSIAMSDSATRRSEESPAVSFVSLPFLSLAWDPVFQWT